MAPRSTPTLDLALDHYSDRQRFVGAAGEVAGRMWSEVDPRRIADSWAERIPELTTVVSGAQLGVARRADPYVTAALDAEDVAADAVSPIDPAAFAGTASDGRGLATLLTNPVVVTLLSIQDGMDVARALTVGRTNLDMLVRTQVADAGRISDQVSLTTRPRARGYVRVAVGNSCARCLILAGETYKWNQGFKRHPRCDCIHLPIGIANAARFVQDPRRIYDRMSDAQRTRAGFTDGDRRALAEGADIFQVVNARHRPDALYTAGGRSFTREGTTRRGFARSRLGGRAGRITPDQIFREAGDDRDLALDLLYRHGYLIEDPALVRATISSGGVGPGGPVPVVTVRPALAQARTVQDVGYAAEAEAKRLTGRDVRLDFHGQDLGIAREHAEGLLRVLEEFPDVQLSVRALPVGNPRAYAQTNLANGELRFNPRFAGDPALYRNALANDGARGFHLRYETTPAGTGAHEAAHAVHGQFNEIEISRRVSRLIDAQAQAAGMPVDDYIVAELGRYSISHMRELIAAAGADAILAGPAASPLSRGVLQIMRDLHAAGPMRAAAARIAPSVALDLTRLTVKQLQDIARARGITIPARARKADIIEALERADVPEPAGVRGLSSDPDVRAVQIENRIRQAYDQTPKVPAGWVLVRDLREQLADLPRAEVDRILIAMGRQRHISLMPDDRQGALTQADRDAAVRINDRAFHFLWIQDGNALRPLPSTAEPAGVAAARQRQAAITRTRAVADTVGEVVELLGNEASATVLAHRAAAIAARTAGETKAALAGLVRAMKTGDTAKIERAVVALERKAGLRRVGGHGPGDVADFDRKAHTAIGDESVAAGAKVRIVRPGYDATLDGEELRLARAQVEPLTPAEIRDIERRAQRAAARERNRLIESRAGTARLLAEIDDLLAKKAEARVIRERLDPALIAPEMPFANADPKILDALRKALDAGDAAKLRTAVTSATRKAGLKPIGKAGAKTKFDPDTMESVAGVDIPAGAQVQVVRRGATLTLPDGTELQITKAQVVSTAPVAPVARTRPGPTMQARTDELARLGKTKPTGRPRPLGGGYSADTATVPYGSTTVVRKTFGQRVADRPGVAPDKEYFGAQIADAVGVRAAAVVRTGPQSIDMQFIEGQTWDEIGGWGWPQDPAKMAQFRTFADSDDGRMLGIADFLMGNTDRNSGNWMLTPNGDITAIDHGYAFEIRKANSVPAGDFTEFLQNPRSPEELADVVDVAPADLAVIRTHLEALRESFDASGRSTWHTQVMRRLKELEKRADPAARIRLAVTT